MLGALPHFYAKRTCEGKIKIQFSTNRYLQLLQKVHAFCFEKRTGDFKWECVID